MEQAELADQPKSGFGQIQENIRSLQRKIREVCEKAPRPRRPEDIRIVPVSKGHPAPAVRVAVAAGFCEFGENRVQEALAKSNELPDLGVRWHLVGTLQTNKVRQAVRLFGMIQSVDRPELGSALRQECERQGVVKDILIQVEATGEAAKHGVKVDEVMAVAKTLRGFGSLRVRGLMAIGPLTDDRRKTRSCFQLVHDLFQKLRLQGDFGETFDTLSMGMSDDFEIAIEEGSTLIRVGTLIFGPRPPQGGH